MTHRWDHHPPCPGGCGELADECMTPACGNPLGSMRIEAPVGSDDSARREAAIQAMIDKGHTRERAEAVFGLINKALFGPGGRFEGEVPR